MCASTHAIIDRDDGLKEAMNFMGHSKKFEVNFIYALFLVFSSKIIFFVCSVVPCILYRTLTQTWVKNGKIQDIIFYAK